jgi:hypothetical protein
MDDIEFVNIFDARNNLLKEFARLLFLDSNIRFSYEDSSIIVAHYRVL